MNYIIAKQFLKQSFKVQQVLRNWYFGNITTMGMVLKPIGGGSYDILMLINIDNKEFLYRNIMSGYTYVTTSNILSNILPLFNESNLRNFIEEKIGCKVGAEFSHHEYRVWIYKDSIGHNDYFTNYYDTNQIDLLQAYWQVACKIAKEGDE